MASMMVTGTTVVTDCDISGQPEGPPLVGWLVSGCVPPGSWFDSELRTGAGSSHRSAASVSTSDGSPANRAVSGESGPGRAGGSKPTPTASTQDLRRGDNPVQPTTSASKPKGSREARRHPKGPENPARQVRLKTCGGTDPRGTPSQRSTFSGNPKGSCELEGTRRRPEMLLRSTLTQSSRSGSSSIVTPLAVAIVTLARNLDWRYMSHTQASVSS